MRIKYPPTTLLHKLSGLQPMTVFRHNRECYIASNTFDTADMDFATGEPGRPPDIMCLNINTGSIDTLPPDLDVEVMNASMNIEGAKLTTEQPVVSEHLPLTPEEIGAIRDFKKIEAIKLLRTRTGLGLKEAKDLVDVESARLGY